MPVAPTSSSPVRSDRPDLPPWTSGGYRVSGQWGFASGCEHASRSFANCVEDVDGDQRIHTVLLTPVEVDIIDTWHVSGLRGPAATISVPRRYRFRPQRTLLTLEHEPCIDVTVVRIPPPMLFAPLLASIAIGIAQGAVDRIVALATDKVPLFDSVSLAANPWFHYQLATIDTELRAAVALLSAQAEEVWVTATSPRSHTAAAGERACGRGMGDRACWRRRRDGLPGGGGTSLYDASPLQRRLRVDQHRDPALPRKARHDDDGGSDLRRARRRRAHLLRAPPRARL